ncbi:MAG: AAA family ATPase [Actinomycetota bacterium]|nr:AAA family ATPase [Actinomycetota bacterium]
MKLTNRSTASNPSDRPVSATSNASVTSTALLQGSQVFREGRADVSRIRERSRRKRWFRLFFILALVDTWFWYRFATHTPQTRPFGMPTIPQEFVFWMPALILGVLLVGVMLAPMMSGRSPHMLIRPEQIELGLTEVRGLDGQVDEVARTLDVFLGYATFRDELGGNPRRGMLFEGPPGTGKTYLAKAMAKQAGVPFLFISSPSFTSMWQGQSARRVRAFFKTLRKLARKEGGAIGFIEEIDAVAGVRGGMNASPLPAGDGLARTVSMFGGGGDTSAMVNQLLIELQSFDEPPTRARIKARLSSWINAYLPAERQLRTVRPPYNNILLIAATNRADQLDPALLRPGRFDRRLYFDLPTKSGRADLIDFFLDRKSHHMQLDEPAVRERLSHDTFGYTPVMIEHLFDESLLVALREGRREMNVNDVYEAKLTEELGIKQPVIYTDGDRSSVATHEAGHATVAYFLGKGRRLEVLSIIKRRQALGLLAHGETDERFLRSRTEIEAMIAIALGGLVSEELFLGESGTGPANDLSAATDLAAKMVGSYGMAGSLVSFDAINEGPIGRQNLVGKVLSDSDGKRRTDDILAAQKVRVASLLDENRDVVSALRDALLERDELVGDEILSVVEKALSARSSSPAV